MANDMRKLFKEATAGGWVITDTGGNHFKLKHTTGPIVFVSRTASDYRAIRNVRADMRRALRNGGTRC